MTSMRPDPYDVLGISPDATQAEISRAYRALLRHYHPDTRAGSNHARDPASDAALQRGLGRLHDPP